MSGEATPRNQTTHDRSNRSFSPAASKDNIPMSIWKQNVERAARLFGREMTLGGLVSTL